MLLIMNQFTQNDDASTTTAGNLKNTSLNKNSDLKFTYLKLNRLLMQ